jgi:hypothetical protein
VLAVPATYQLAQVAGVLVDTVAMVARAVLSLLQHLVILAHPALVVLAVAVLAVPVPILAEAEAAPEY